MDWNGEMGTGFMDVNGLTGYVGYVKNGVF
jgi:hypothetical protein